MSTTIYGASDDLIELEGDVYDEFDAYPGDTLRYLTFNDNTVLSIQYANEGDGIWRIELVRQGTNTVTIQRADTDDEDNYSDRATIHGPVATCALTLHRLDLL